jgi:anti-sigma factor ChrR (cupin superfamily)
MQAQKKNVLAWAAGDIKWIEMKGGPPGAMFANLSGDIMKGAYGTFVKLPAGMSNPLHSHSSDTKLIVISGTFWIQPEGGQRKELGPGSYLFQPGKVKHMSGTGAGSDCVVFQESTGKFDFVPGDGAPAKN